MTDHTENNTWRRPVVQSDGPKLPPAPLPKGWDARLQPLPIAEAAAHLSRCLTLCAPSGMSVDDRAEWLTVALEAIGELPAEVFIEACRQAQRQCEHPAKIVPTIHEYGQAKAGELRRLLQYQSRPRLVQPAPVELPEPEARPAMTQADVDALPGYLVSLGMKIGYLREEAGRVVFVPENAA